MAASLCGYTLPESKSESGTKHIQTSGWALLLERYWDKPVKQNEHKGHYLRYPPRIASGKNLWPGGPLWFRKRQRKARTLTPSAEARSHHIWSHLGGIWRPEASWREDLPKHVWFSAESGAVCIGWLEAHPHTHTSRGPLLLKRRLREVPGEPGEGLEELCESSGGPYI